MIARFRAIRYNNNLKGRDKIIFDTVKQYPHVNPPVVASSSVALQIQRKTYSQCNAITKCSRYFSMVF